MRAHNTKQQHSNTNFTAKVQSAGGLTPGAHAQGFNGVTQRIV